MWGFIGGYVVGLISGVLVVALLCANGRNNDDNYHGGVA